MKRRHPEQDFHKAAAAYLRAVLPEDAFWTTFPAGGGGKIRGAQLKAMGLQAGVPDILIIHHGVPIFLELKAPNGRLSEAQKFIHSIIDRALGWVYVCRSIEDIEAALSLRHIPLAGKLAA